MTTEKLLRQLSLAALALAGALLLPQRLDAQDLPPEAAVRPSQDVVA